MLIFTSILRRVVVTAIVLAIPLGVVEFVARKALGSALASALTAPLGARPSVSFPARPVLLSLVGGSIGEAEIRAGAVPIVGLPPAKLGATLHDVHLGSLLHLTGVVGSVTATVTVGESALAVWVRRSGCVPSLPPALRAVLTARPRVLIFGGRVDLLPPHGRAGEAQLRPLARAGALVLVARLLELSGARLPTGSSGCERSLAGAPLGLRLAGVDSAPGVLTLRLSARNSSFSPLR